MFFVAILAFVWTTGSISDNPQPPSSRPELVIRIVITAIFALGLLYFALIVFTFKSYGNGKQFPQSNVGTPPRITAAIPLTAGNTDNVPGINLSPISPLGPGVNALQLYEAQNSGSGSSGRDDLEKQDIFDGPGRTASPRL